MHLPPPTPNSYYNKSRDLVRLVGLGMVVPCGRVEHVEGSVVTCEGPVPKQTMSFEVDVILFATGYRYRDCAIVALQNIFSVPRWKEIFPVTDENIACVGYIRPYLTSIPMLIEMQSRLVAKVFAGVVVLPDQERRVQEEQQDRDKRKREFPCHHERMPFLVDPYDYMHEMATLMGAKIPYCTLLSSDPILVYYLIFDSWNHFAYRLADPVPEKRALAREMIYHYHNHKTSKRIRYTGVSKVIQFVLFMVLIVSLFLWLTYRLITYTYKFFLTDNRAQTHPNHAFLYTRSNRQHHIG